MYCSSATTTRRAIWNLSSCDSELGSRDTIRLCSRANSVWVAVRPMFSLARGSPAMRRVLRVRGQPAVGSAAGAVAALPRASAWGR